MIRSSRTALAIAGSISGSGFEQANTTGLGAIFLSCSPLSKSGPDKPTNTSAPSMASSRVRLSVSLANIALYWFKSSRPEWITPLRSSIKIFSERAPQLINSMKLLISCGARSENIFMLDRKGVIHSGRDDLNQYKAMFANDTDKRTLDDAIDGADVFVGLSGPDLLSGEQLKKMAPNPVVFACSNPDPEIDPAIANAVRDDLIMATGRSDYPNQVNNVLGFPFIFRGALDVRATVINEEMKIAAVNAIRELAKEPVPQEICEAYGADSFEFGRNYIIPKPMDVRLLEVVPAAVA